MEEKNKKQPKYMEGIGWRYETEHSMNRRMEEHDYQSRSIYMITMTVADRKPLLGSVRWTAADASDAHLEASMLGAEVERCWYEISAHYPEVKVLAFQLMPDHVHGLLFVTREMEVHIGKVLKGFKIGCSRAWWRLSECEGAGMGYSPLNYNSTNTTNTTAPTNTTNTTNTIPPSETAGSKDREQRPPLFAPGYQDSVLKGKVQTFRYLRTVNCPNCFGNFRTIKISDFLNR